MENHSLFRCPRPYLRYLLKYMNVKISDVQLSVMHFYLSSHADTLRTPSRVSFPSWGGTRDERWQGLRGRLLFSSLRRNTDKNFGRFAENITKTNLHLQNTNYTETTSVKMIVLLQPRGFPNTPTPEKITHQGFTYVKPRLNSARVRSRKPGIKESKSFEATSNFYA